MIRVSHGKPGIHYNAASNDMGHFYCSEFIAGSWYYMDLYDYIAKYTFEHFDMKPKLNIEEVKPLIDKPGYTVSIVETLGNPSMAWAYEYQQLIKQAGGQQIWEYNAVNKELTGYIRQCSVIGQPSLVRLTWFEVYVKLPVCEKICGILNRLWYYKRKAEIKSWDAFIAKMRK